MIKGWLLIKHKLNKKSFLNVIYSTVYISIYFFLTFAQKCFIDGTISPRLSKKNLLNQTFYKTIQRYISKFYKKVVNKLALPKL